MYLKVLLPIAAVGLASYVVISTVTSNNNIEYYDSSKHRKSKVINRYNPKDNRFKSNKKKSAQSFQVPVMNRYEKPLVGGNPSVTENNAPMPAPGGKKANVKDNKKKKKKTNFKIGKKKKKKKQRKPSHAKKQEKKQNEEKLDVPANLPVVNQVIYNSGSVVPVSNHTQVNHSSSNGSTNNSNINNNTSGQGFVSPGTNTNPPSDSQNFESLLMSEDALEVVNFNYKRSFIALAPILKRRMEQEIFTAIKDHFENNPDLGLEISKINSLDFNLEAAPAGLKLFGTNGLTAAFPAKGSWDIKVKAQVQYENDMFKADEEITIHVKNINLNYPMRIDQIENGLTFITEYLPETLKYEVELSSSSFLTNIIVSTFSAFFPNFLDASIKDSMQALNLEFKNLVIKTVESIPAPNTNNYNEVEPANLNIIVNNIDNKIQSQHLYHGTIHALDMKEDANQTWVQAFDENGEGIKGEVEGQRSINNSAKLTGMYLASLAFKYKVTNSAQTKNSINNVLAGIEKLISINQNTGLLARSITPLDSKLAQDLIAKGGKVGSSLNYGNIEGVPWLSYQGENGISFDQYNGIIFGLAQAYLHTNDSEIKSKVSKIVKILVDYLRKNYWMTSKEVFALAEAGNLNGPTLWDGINFQKLAILKFADELHPNVYESELRSVSNMAEAAWLNLFFKITDPIKNTKVMSDNLTNLYLYYQFEQAPNLRSQMLKSVQLIDFYYQNNRNIYFDIIISAIQNEKISSKSKNIKVGLYKTLNRPHRKTRATNVDLQAVETESRTLPNGESVTIAKSPMAPELMMLNEEFLWENSSVEIDKSETENARVENIGLDITLPYWMGRYHNLY